MHGHAWQGDLYRGGLSVTRGHYQRDSRGKFALGFARTGKFGEKESETQGQG